MAIELRQWQGYKELAGLTGHWWEDEGKKEAEDDFRVLSLSGSNTIDSDQEHKYWVEWDWNTCWTLRFKYLVEHWKCASGIQMSK